MSKISYLKSKWFYHLYERKLELQIKKEPFPNHIAIILDGNRRWAKYRLWGNMEGHDMGADKAEELLNWIYELRIKITTLFVLSNDNLSREEHEIDNIYSLLEKKLDRLYKDSRIHERRMKIKAIGSTETLPSSLKQILSNLENSTSEYDSMFLNIAVAYGGQQELVDAIKKVSIKTQYYY